ELKRLIVEASEAVDDKSAANDFQETLERIVNEIRNTTEHSGPFLQKVRKADVPDYYDVIKRPMDLATLLKKVKQQAYRTKKAFAEDLDLIWSNCLLYNSHPNHPLRHSAEALRQKSNQLLEFITDPALTQRQLLLATRIGTPDDDADGEADSDDDDARSKRAISERLLNGANGDCASSLAVHRDSSASPAPSRSATPSLARRLNRKISTASPPLTTSRPQLARITASPEPTPPPAELPFEEHHAFVRTPQNMQEFLLLDQELTRLEGSGFKPVRSSAILPSSAFDSSASTALAPPPQQKKRQKKEHVAELIARLNADVLPFSLAPPPPPPSKKRAAGRAGAGEGMSAKMRRNCETLRRIRRVGDTLARESTAGEMESPYVSAAEEDEEEGDDDALAGDNDAQERPAKRRRASKATGLVRVSGLPREALQSTATRGTAAREAMRAIGAGMLEHAGFEGASGGALDVLGHLAGEYLSNLGRTLRFYADRYSTDLSEKDILTRTLSENGIPSPSHLSAHVTEDVDRYGQRLSDLLAKLERTRKEQLDSFFAPSAAANDEVERAEKVFDDEEAFVVGDWANRIGEDYFGLTDQGLDAELVGPSLVLPKWLLRGEPRPLDNESTRCVSIGVWLGHQRTLLTAARLTRRTARRSPTLRRPRSSPSRPRPSRPRSASSSPSSPCAPRTPL
ncbi:hypothetical protein DMC30DRAFT_354181, partial [Rhodotorula diobovata]